MKPTARALTALAVLVAILLPSASSATQREPIQNLTRNAWTELGDRIEAGAAYATAVAVNGGAMVCPLPGSTFVDSWGAPRDGGARSHLGVDMLAPDGRTVYAPASGDYRPDGPESFYIEAVDGALYFGTHMSSQLRPAGPVRAGEPVAVNSDTGNAAGTPHLHLQIAPDGSTWENPYPATADACSNPTAAPTFGRTLPRVTASQIRFCRYVVGGIGPRFIGCLHVGEGHAQGQPGHLWTNYVAQARQFRRFLLGLVPPIPYEANWDRVAACESGGNWSINTGNGFYGGLQFDYGTWLGAGGGQYAERADLASKREQILIAERVRADRGLSPWPHCGPRWYG